LILTAQYARALGIGKQSPESGPKIHRAACSMIDRAEPGGGNPTPLEQHVPSPNR
jgi:hypothetical protein